MLKNYERLSYKNILEEKILKNYGFSAFF